MLPATDDSTDGGVEDGREREACQDQRAPAPDNILLCFEIGGDGAR